MQFDIGKLLQQYGGIAVVSATVGAVLGAILTKFIPYIWSAFAKVCTKLGAILGGRFAHRSFERRYLDWIVTELRELKLTGIVSYDESKKPQLEQVFVSLRVAEKSGSGLPSNVVEDILSRYKNVAGLRDVLETADLTGTSESLPTFRDPRLKYKLKQLLGYDLGLLQNQFPPDLQASASDYQDATRTIKKAMSREGVSSVELDEAIRKFLSSRRTLEIAGFLTPSSDESNELSHVLRKYQRIAMLGSPGAGKTTLLQYIALAYARKRAGDPRLRNRRILRDRLRTRKWRVPVFIPLGSIAGKLVEKTSDGRDQTILDTLTGLLPPDFQRNYEHIAPAYFADKLRRGKCIVLMDGLDEVPTQAEFQAVVKAIESLAITYERNQFIVTSRMAGWRSGIDGDFKIFHVEDLNDEQVSTFIDTWYTAVERNAVVGELKKEGKAERQLRERRATKRASELKRALKENVGIRHLATNPMLLSIIALVHRSLATLPKERGKLYAECVKVLLEQWDISRGIRVDDTNLKLEQKEALMRRIAFALHTGEIGDKGGGREAARLDIQKTIADMLPNFGRPAGDALHLLQRIIERSGIITERRRDVLAFAHLTFQEYFTAKFLIHTGQSKKNGFLSRPEYFLADWWREVVLLYSGLLPDSSKFLKSIYNVKVDDLCQQKLRLVSFCLNEAVEIKEAEVRQLIARNLLKVSTRAAVIKTQQPLPSTVINYLVRTTKDQQWLSDAAATTIKTLQDNPETSSLKEKILAALGNPQSGIRQAALSGLLSLNNDLILPDYVEKTAELLSDSDEGVSSEALNTLKIIALAHPSEKVIQALIDKAAGSFSSYDRETLEQSVTCITILAEITNKNALAPSTVSIISARLLDIFKSRRHDIASIKALIQIFVTLADQLSKEDVNTLLDWIINKAPQSSSAIEQLGYHEYEVLEPKIINTIINRMYSDDFELGALNLLTRETLIEQDVINKLAQMLTKHRANKYAITEIIESLLQLTRKGLEAEVNANLEGLLRSDLSENVYVINSLSKSHLQNVSEGIINIIISTVKSRDKNLRLAAVATASRLRTDIHKERITEALIAASQDVNHKVRSISLLALTGISKGKPSPTIVNIIRAALDDRKGAVRATAAMACASLEPTAVDTGIIEKLIQAALISKKPWMKLMRLKLPLLRRKAPLHYWREYSDLAAIEESPLEAITVYHAVGYQLTAVTALGLIGKYKESDRISNILIELTKDFFKDVVSYSHPRWQSLKYTFISRDLIQDEAFKAIINIAQEEYSEEAFQFIFNTFYSILLARPDLELTRIEKAYPLTEIANLVPQDHLATRIQRFFDEGNYAALSLGYLLIKVANKQWAVQFMKDRVIASLEDDDFRIRLLAINSLRELAEPELIEYVMPTVLKCLEDENENIRQTAWELVALSNKESGVWI